MLSLCAYLFEYFIYYRTIKNDVVKVRGLLPVSPKANVVKNTGFDAHDPYVSSDEEVGE